MSVLRSQSIAVEIADTLHFVRTSAEFTSRVAVKLLYTVHSVDVFVEDGNWLCEGTWRSTFLKAHTLPFSSYIST